MIQVAHSIWYYIQILLLFLIASFYENSFLSLYLQYSDCAPLQADSDKNSFQLGPICLSSHPPPFSSFFDGRISSRLASSPSFTPAPSPRCRGESVLSSFSRQIPPGARRIPVIASSKLRCACTLTQMKERLRERIGLRDVFGTFWHFSSNLNC